MSLQDFFNYGFGALTVGRILSSLLLLLICLILMKCFNKFAGNVLGKTKIDVSLRGFLTSALRIVLWFLTILVVAGNLGIPISSLVAVFSIAGLAASLAMQNTLSNFASGILILVTHPFRVGDYIECGAVGGTVKNISLVYTQLDTPDNRLIFIPNSEVSASKIINYSSEAVRRLELKVTAAYAHPAEQVKEALSAAIAATSGILENREIFVGINSYHPHAIQYVLRVWCNNDAYWNIYYALTEEVKAQFDARGIQMFYRPAKGENGL